MATLRLDHANRRHLKWRYSNRRHSKWRHSKWRHSKWRHSNWRHSKWRNPKWRRLNCRHMWRRLVNHHLLYLWLSQTPHWKPTPWKPRQLTCLLTPLTDSLSSHYSLCSRALLGLFVRSLILGLVGCPSIRLFWIIVRRPGGPRGRRFKCDATRCSCFRCLLEFSPTLGAIFSTNFLPFDHLISCLHRCTSAAPPSPLPLPLTYLLPPLLPMLPPSSQSTRHSVTVVGIFPSSIHTLPSHFLFIFYLLVSPFHHQLQKGYLSISKQIKSRSDDIMKSEFFFHLILSTELDEFEQLQLKKK